ncbi:CU044_5270 family protein [Streptomyces sp. NBC_00059]|uniref:CU044_5270 family protein n=1 Tax=Streptomyces sp. NBC_00059 TaxID=2975635 RepID=UPI002252CF3A|nr:CU044_5270 family protein [Streptomyces sp. NBC_00059]MCX5410971.1 CU044_5270 family protein [Streptomyces sp. NBC_00059]
MNDLTALRELEADVPALTEDARAAARTRLSEAVATEGRWRAGVPSRRLVLRAVFTATAAAAVAGTVVVATDGGGPRMTALSAAQVLDRAADRYRADGAGTPVPRDNQYLYAREVYTRTPGKGGRRRTTHMDEFWISADGSRPSRYVYDGRIKNQPPLSAHEMMWPPTEYSKLEKLPTDPDELLELFTESSSGGMSTYMDFLMLMRGPRVMPPGLQPAAFEALAKLPGIVLDEDEVDALGRHGIGVTYPGMSIGLVFEQGTYAYLGLRLEGVRGARTKGTELVGGEKYIEVRGRVKSGVVDEIGQRPR